MDKVIEIQNIVKNYQVGSVIVRALRSVTINIEKNEYVAIMGPSGSGKSTLMNILGCLDRPTAGEYWLDGEQVAGMDDDQLASVRNRKIGFIFQSFNLLSRVTALSNVELPLRYAGSTNGNGHTAPAPAGNGDAVAVVPPTRKERARAALESVGLADRLYHKPTELSGGQQQRVAIARALVNQPAMIMADEPTGNLDSKVGQEIMDLLLNLNRERGTTLVIVTHDPRIAAQTQRTIHIQDGVVNEESGL